MNWKALTAFFCGMLTSVIGVLAAINVDACRVIIAIMILGGVVVAYIGLLTFCKSIK